MNTIEHFRCNGLLPSVEDRLHAHENPARPPTREHIKTVNR